MSNGGLVDRVVCLSLLSKDLEGELRLVESAEERCRERDCVTLETIHQLDLKAARHDCDSAVGSLLDGRLHVGDLVHKFEGGDGTHRGVHEASFRWRSGSVLASGTLRGVTNAGTHRAPAFDDCQRCDDVGVMEGQLVGRIRRARDPRLVGCTLQAAYRLRFDASRDGGSGGVRGTLEGAIVCDCTDSPPRTCVELAALTVGAGSNPRVEQGVSFSVHDFQGNPAASTQISTQGSFTGLNVDHSTDVTLPFQCSAVEATLVTFANPATLEAFNSNGNSAGIATMSGTQGVPETLTVTGSAIDRAVITAKQDETWLLRLCFEPLR